MVSKLLLFTPKTILYNLAYKKYKHLNIKHIKHSLKLTAIFELLIKKKTIEKLIFFILGFYPFCHVFGTLQCMMLKQTSHKIMQTMIFRINQ